MQPRAAPPNGSYTGSCEQVFVDGENLRANCRNRGGGLVATILPNFGQCAMDIFNDDGSLGCGRGVPVRPAAIAEAARKSSSTATNCGGLPNDPRQYRREPSPRLPPMYRRDPKR